MSLFPFGRAALNVGPADAGRRLRIEHDLGFGHGDGTTEGVLLRWTGGARDGILRLRNRSGTTIPIRASDIRAARVMSPEVSAFDMQRLVQQGWPPGETEMLGDWELRYTGGQSHRANSTRVTTPPGRNLKSVLASVEHWYRERGATPRLQSPIPAGMEEELGGYGWTEDREGRLMTCSVPRLCTETTYARGRPDLKIEINSRPDEPWFSLVTGYTRKTAKEFRSVVAAPGTAAYIYCRNLDGELLGIGRATLQDTWCGITTLETKAQSRRSGIARAVIAEMAEWGRERGAASSYIEAFGGHPAAQSFFERIGFTTHHTYAYFRKA